MKRLVTLAAFALAFALAPAAAQGVLKVGDQRGGSRALMEAAGVLADLPYKIEWSEFPAAAPLLEALNAAAIDTGIVGDAPFTFAVASGAPIRAIMATQQDQGGLAILVRPDSPVRTLADLKGKRIGTGRGSVGHQLVLAALEDAGIPKSAVTLSFLLPAEAKAALTSGSLDAWSTWEPYTSQLERSGEARIVRDGQGITPGLGFQVAHLDAIRAKRPLLEDFVRRLAKARVWGTANHASYAETWSKLIGLPKEVPLAWFTRANVRPLPIDAAVVAAEQRTIDLYVRNGLIPKRLEAAEILDPSFNATVVSGSRRPPCCWAASGSSGLGSLSDLIDLARSSARTPFPRKASRSGSVRRRSSSVVAATWAALVRFEAGACPDGMRTGSPTPPPPLAARGCARRRARP